MSIYIRSIGKGIPMVFFHGWGFDSNVWLPLTPFLEKSYQLFLVDLPGFGHTSPMDWQAFKEKLLLVLPERFFLIGWSMGGLFATRLTLEAPTRIKYLINITSSPYFIADNQWPGVAKEVFQVFYRNLEQNFNKVLQEFMSLQVGKKRFEMVMGSNPSRDSLKKGLHILQEWDFRESLKSCPTGICYMFGRLDPIVPLHTMEFMKSNYPQYEYVLFRKAAHMPFLSHSDLFVAELLQITNQAI